jgi:nicotinate-nucleotide pyrophosphorylase (carboxylating)
LIMLDNMGPDEVHTAVIETGGRALLEVSGGVRLEQVRAFAVAGADIISVGALTTRAPWIDIALDME